MHVGEHVVAVGAGGGVRGLPWQSQVAVQSGEQPVAAGAGVIGLPSQSHVAVHVGEHLLLGLAFPVSEFVVEPLELLFDPLEPVVVPFDVDVVVPAAFATTGFLRPAVPTFGAGVAAVPVWSGAVAAAVAVAVPPGSSAFAGASFSLPRSHATSPVRSAPITNTKRTIPTPVFLRIPDSASRALPILRSSGSTFPLSARRRVCVCAHARLACGENARSRFVTARESAGTTPALTQTVNKTLVFTLAATVLAIAARAEAQPPPQQQQPKPEETEKTEPDPKARLVWLDAEAGIASTNLDTFTENFHAFSVGFLPRSGVGPSFGAGAGVRLVFVTLGLRGRVASFTDSDPTHDVHGWTMASLDGELGFRAPLGRLEPYMTLAAGYTTLGGLGDAVHGLSSGIDVNGFDTRVAIGFDYFLGKNVSLGLNGSAELLALTRPGVPVREIAAIPQTQTLDDGAIRFLEANGSTYGTALTLNGGLKVSF